MAAYDFPDTAGKPTDGSFEYTAPDGTLYEWNGYAWVVPTDESGGGSGGAARVLTQVLPPSPAEDGDMYWCTDDGRLYLYYDDADTKQWVDASPDGGGNNVEKLIAGDNITLSPADGKGVVTINSTGGGGGPTTPGVRYQEGNWTPVFSSGSMNSPQAFWTRSGNTVFVTLDQNWATVPSGGDDFGIEGLPYASNIYASGSLYVENKDSELVAIPFTQKNENKIAVKGVSTKAAYTSTFNVSNGFFKDGYLNITLVYTTDDTTFVPSTGATVTEDIQGTGGSGGGTTVNNNGASAWGNFKKDGTINGSLNIASVTKTATGSYDVVFTTPMPSNAYSVVLSNRSESGGNEYGYLFTKALTNSGFTISGIDANQSPDDFAICFAVHSANAIAPQSGVGADAWAYVDADGSTVHQSFNVASVDQFSQGIYDVVFTTPMPSGLYAINLTGQQSNPVVYVNTQTATGFRLFSEALDGTPVNGSFYFAVHASSTVTPTYTWTRDGTTLKPANDGDSIEAGAATFAGDVSVDKYLTVTNSDFSADAKVVIQGDNDVAVSVYPPVLGAPRTIELRHDGSATFSGNTLVGNFDLSESNTSGVRVLASGGLQLQRDSAASNSPRFEIIRGTGDKTVVINSDGSATFTGNVKSTRGSGDCFYAGPNTPGAFDGAGFVCDLSTKDSGNSRYFKGNYNGTEVFGVTKEGTTTFRNAFINLEPDNSANYVSTMVDGVETQVYNGPTLDVKELLLTLQTAATRIATLEAKVATLESDHTTLMNNNNNNGGGY